MRSAAKRQQPTHPRPWGLGKQRRKPRGCFLKATTPRFEPKAKSRKFFLDWNSWESKGVPPQCHPPPENKAAYRSSVYNGGTMMIMRCPFIPIMKTGKKRITGVYLKIMGRPLTEKININKNQWFDPLGFWREKEKALGWILGRLFRNSEIFTHGWNYGTLPTTNSQPQKPLKMGRTRKEISSSNHWNFQERLLLGLWALNFLESLLKKLHSLKPGRLQSKEKSGVNLKRGSFPTSKPTRSWV